MRQWKLSEVDLQAQDLWDEFTQKKFELLRKTHTKLNPWHVIRSNRKSQARLETIKLILREIPYQGRSRTLDFKPNGEVVIRGDVEAKLMQRQHKSNGKFDS